MPEATNNPTPPNRKTRRTTVKLQSKLHSQNRDKVAGVRANKLLHTTSPQSPATPIFGPDGGAIRSEENASAFHDVPPSSMEADTTRTRHAGGRPPRADVAEQVRDGLLLIYGSAALLIGRFSMSDGQIVAESAEPLVDAWVNVGKQNKAVMRILVRITKNSAYLQCAMVHASLVLVIGVNHGVFPADSLRFLGSNAPPVGPQTQGVSPQWTQPPASPFTPEFSQDSPLSGSPSPSFSPDSSNMPSSTTPFTPSTTPQPIPQPTYTPEQIAALQQMAVQQAMTAQAARNGQSSGGPEASYNPLATRPPQEQNPAITSNLTQRRG